jgi:hypothetical protein
VAIIKPQRKTAEQSLEEVEEAIRGGAIGGIMDIGLVFNYRFFLNLFIGLRPWLFPASAGRHPDRRRRRFTCSPSIAGHLNTVGNAEAVSVEVITFFIL